MIHSTLRNKASLLFFFLPYLNQYSFETLGRFRITHTLFCPLEGRCYNRVRAHV